MKRKLTYLAIVVLTSIGFYCIGYFFGYMDCSAEEKDNMHKWINMEKTFLKDYLGNEKTPNLKSGAYELTIFMPDMSPQKIQYELQFRDGSPVFKNSEPSGCGLETIEIEGNSVTWSDEGAAYSFGAEFVGVIRGDRMWGHVYVVGNRDETTIGLWKLLPVQENKARILKEEKNR